jgi:hypothetical protein
VNGLLRLGAGATAGSARGQLVVNGTPPIGRVRPALTCTRHVDTKCDG